ncbi:MAG: triose-phosphate isomerase [Oscillospiraceae bacterium]|nr:triose-phosphate isomerase [Oscillospiraceae bacterium]
MQKNKKFIVAPNWKMYMTNTQAQEFVHSIDQSLANKAELMLFAPATAICAIAEETRRKGIIVGAQNMYWEEEGAYTGEISAPMIKDAGGTHVIVGHSKRRTLFGETDVEVNLKVRAAQRHGLTPLVCIGEEMEERTSGAYHKVLTQQIVAGLIGVRAEPLIIAYEPVWAIGSGQAATVEQVRETMGWIRRVLVEQFGGAGCNIPLLYGGSAKPENAAELAAIDSVDGFLIGRAGLKVDSLKAIIDQVP